MKNLILFTVLILNLVSVTFAQEKPLDLVNQLPHIFIKICDAKNDEVQSYGKILEDFKNRVNSSLDSLALLKIKAQKSANINPKSNTTSLNKELDLVKSKISTRDFSVEFDKALNNEAEKLKSKKIEDITIKMGQTSDYAVMEKLLDEINQAALEYCNSSSPKFIDLLIQQRAVLEIDIANIVKASDLKQQIECDVLDYTYFFELSYETAYIYILDHLKYMSFLLGLAPGNE
ncbi:MAG: hypothetical protein EHM44_04415 [Ignavibacteriales bacterium]|nr:MAG: hypothetical protein EHM44_04415 [Ignavibacteriales bacterium]